MLLKIPAGEIFFKDYGWHSGHFHFSFGDYIDPQNKGFGVLFALNDFMLKPMSGFETHPHAEVEIASYCVQGTLAHKDILGNEQELGRGDSQYTCTGSGITHSEMNPSPDESLRFVQIWIKPRMPGMRPHYNMRPLFN